MMCVCVCVSLSHCILTRFSFPCPFVISLTGFWLSFTWLLSESCLPCELIFCPCHFHSFISAYIHPVILLHLTFTEWKTAKLVCTWTQKTLWWPVLPPGISMLFSDLFKFLSSVACLAHYDLLFVLTLVSNNWFGEFLASLEMFEVALVCTGIQAIWITNEMNSNSWVLRHWPW